ncbi:methyltransferase domain-containing protein [Aeromonas sp. 2HA2]|uniref:class I SAM-dependent methyltransferase n=1 Tax=Aeromonas TaxID=642 RepID=UPI0023DE1226|nr:MULTISPECIES: methyltransferase domain-containing protein [Aeromonas]MDF2409784.1 methyltransferase domain-containing protein [Aeromonas sp. 2HA2]MDM5062877.1 class I SAM-dependent methyltransferase [Aeromonas salmonicida]
MDNSNVYNKGFYQDQASASYRSGVKVLSCLFDMIKKPDSILDIGCGTGSWLAAAHYLGVEDVIGVDGSSSAKKMLMIPDRFWLEENVGQKIELGRKFSLALSLEVAEHLPIESHATLISNLTCHSDVILFSAAIPYQGGTGHQSENWPSYWNEHFIRFGFDCFDIIRPAIWNMPGVNFWYKQNIMLFVRKGGACEEIGLDVSQKTNNPLSLIHPEMYLWAIKREGGLSLEKYSHDICYYLALKDKKESAFIDIPRYGSEYNNEF